MLLTDNEQDLIETIRKTDCSHIKIYVQNHIPLRIEEQLDSRLLGKHKKV
jgi:hypothetical protein